MRNVWVFTHAKHPEATIMYQLRHDGRQGYASRFQTNVTMIEEPSLLNVADSK